MQLRVIIYMMEKNFKEKYVKKTKLITDRKVKSIAIQLVVDL